MTAIPFQVKKRGYSAYKIGAETCARLQIVIYLAAQENKNEIFNQLNPRNKN